MRRIVGNRLGSDVLTVGRVAVSTEMKQEMQKILSDYETGVRLVTVELQDVTPPDLVKPAFNEVNEARCDSGSWLLGRLLGRPASESGTLFQGGGGYE
jgi:membrane protease subunit HflK